MTANKSIRGTLIEDSVRIISANLFSLPIGMVSTLLIARILGPELTGVTATTILLVLNYTVNAHLGTLNALGQRYPYLVGQGSAEAGKETKWMLSVVLGFVSIGAGGVAIVVMGLALWQLIIGSRLMALGLSFGAIIAVFQLYKTYYIFIIRSTNQFAYLSRFTLIFSWAPLAWVIGARWGGVVGQWTALGTTELIMALVLYRTVGREIKLKFDLKASWQYIKLGFPIYAVGTLFSFFSTVDRLTAAIFLGTTALGLYGVASMVATFLGIVPGMIGQIMWPRMAEKLGASGRDWREILPYIENPTFLIAFLLPLLIGIVILAIPPMTKALLPRYEPGILAAQISVLAVFSLGLMGMYTTFLGTSLRLLPYGLVTGIGIVLCVASSYLTVRFGWGLEGLAWAKSISYGVVAITLMAYVMRLFGYEWWKIAQRLCVLMAPMAIVYVLTIWLIPLMVSNNSATVFSMFKQMSYQILILIAFTFPLVWVALYKGGIAGDLAEMFKRIFHLETRVI